MSMLGCALENWSAYWLENELEFRLEYRSACWSGLRLVYSLGSELAYESVSVMVCWWEYGTE